MEKKAKELYTKMAGAHPRPQFSVDVQKQIVFWKQPNVFKGSIESEDVADKH